MAVTVPTFDAVYAVVQSEIQSRNASLTDFNAGSALDAIAGGMSMGAEESIRIGIKAFAATFLDTAEGDDLDAVIADRYPEMAPRREESASVVTLTFTRGGSTGVLEIPAGTAVRASVNGKTLTFTTNAAAYMPSDDNEIGVLATCATTGASGNVAAGTITSLVAAIPGDATATVTNAERAVGGAAEEMDTELRSRARLYHSTLRRATVGSLEAAAIAVQGVQFATVDEANMGDEDGSYVALYVGDPDANGNAALAESVALAIEEVRAAGVEVRVTASEREEIPIALTVYVRRNSDRSAIETAVRSTVLAYVNNLAPNKTMYLSQIDRAACVADSNVLGCSISDPSSDQDPSEAFRAIRVLTTDLTVEVVEA